MRMTESLSASCVTTGRWFYHRTKNTFCTMPSSLWCSLKPKHALKAFVVHVKRTNCFWLRCSPVVSWFGVLWCAFAHINTLRLLSQSCFIKLWRQVNVDLVARSLRCESHSNELKSHCSRVIIQAVINRCRRTTNHTVHAQRPIKPLFRSARAHTYIHTHLKGVGDVWHYMLEHPGWKGNNKPAQEPIISPLMPLLS